MLTLSFYLFHYDNYRQGSRLVVLEYQENLSPQVYGDNNNSDQTAKKDTGKQW